MSCGQNKPQKESKTSEYKKVSCSFCKSEKVIKWGLRKTGRGKVQRYCCQECNRKFTVDDGFYRMRNHPQKITQALHLYYSGTSLRKTQEHLGVFNNHNCSYVTILKWIQRYSKLVGNYVDNLKVNVGEELMSDEMEFRTKGEISWFVDVMDTKTRFIVSSDFIKGRTIEAMSKVLKKAKIRTGEQVKIVTTDGMMGYATILKKTFGLHKREKLTKIKHNLVIASERGFNHKIERLHNSIRERTKIFRGFGNLNSAKTIMKGYEIYYNFCRKHQAINKYPYGLAIPELKLGVNKWLDLINLAKNRKLYNKAYLNELGGVN